MKKKIINRFYLIFTIIFLCILLFIIPSCQILNDLSTLDIFKNANTTASSLNQDDLKEMESITSAGNEKSEVNPEETTTTLKETNITINIERCIPEYIGAVIKNNIKEAAGIGYNFDF